MVKTKESQTAAIEVALVYERKLVTTLRKMERAGDTTSQKFRQARADYGAAQRETDRAIRSLYQRSA